MKISASSYQGQVLVWITDEDNPSRHLEAQLRVEDVDEFIRLLQRERGRAVEYKGWSGMLKGAFA